MVTVFDITAAIAVVATILALTRTSPVHGLLYLVVSLLAVASAFVMLGAAFAAALEVILYAGAIVVLFLFVIMMLNLGAETIRQERSWMRRSTWFGPVLLTAALFAELFYAVQSQTGFGSTPAAVDPEAVGLALFGAYVIGVELAGLLLLSGLVGAYHLGRDARQLRRKEEKGVDSELERPRLDTGGHPVHAGAGRRSGAA